MISWSPGSLDLFGDPTGCIGSAGQRHGIMDDVITARLAAREIAGLVARSVGSWSRPDPCRLSAESPPPGGATSGPLSATAFVYSSLARRG